MDRALLHASISTSVQVADLSILGQLIFERMFPHADFQGRLPGHPRKVKATVIPMVDASAEEVAEQLQKMYQSELIIWYESGREKYVQLVSWWRYQDRRFAHPSKYPAPEGWKDRIRYNDPHEPKRLILENWEGVFGEPRKGKRKEDPPPKPPVPDAYVGDLHRPPTKEAQNDPSSSSSASTLKDQNLFQTLPRLDPPLGRGTGGARGRKPKKEYPRAALDVYQAYAENIVAIPAKKPDALRNIAARLQEGYTPEQLTGAVERYYEERQGNSDALPFHANNFFGQKAYFLGYLSEAEPATPEAVHG